MSCPHATLWASHAIFPFTRGVRDEPCKPGYKARLKITFQRGNFRVLHVEETPRPVQHEMHSSAPADSQLLTLRL